MRALVLPAIGQPPRIEAREPPARKAGEVLVRVEAAALNHRDVWIQQGQYPGIRTPIILGSDGCGIIEAADDPARVGERVILDPSLNWGDDPAHQALNYEILGLPRDGTFAEQIALPASNALPLPGHLDFTHAAALPLAGVTAWRTLMTRAALRPGEKVLITGIGGGVALLALQLAVAHGAHVWVTSSSPAKLDRAAALGASGGALYTEADWEQQLRRAVPAGFDVCVDSAGGEGVGALIKLLGMGGRLAFYGGTRGRWPALSPQALFFKQISILGSTMGSHDEFRALLAFVQRHALIPIVDRVYPLEEGATAFADLAAGAQFGKLVLRPGPAK